MGGAVPGSQGLKGALLVWSMLRCEPGLVLDNGGEITQSGPRGTDCSYCSSAPTSLGDPGRGGFFLAIVTTDISRYDALLRSRHDAEHFNWFLAFRPLCNR